MKRNTPLVIKQLNAASNLVDKGISMQDAAEAAGVTYNQLQFHRKKARTVPQRLIFTVAEKIEAAKRVVNGEGAQEVADDLPVALITIQRWVRAYTAGRYTLDNAVAVRRAIPDASHVEKYVIDGKQFDSIEECTRYAVQKLGGIMLTRTVTEAVTL